MRALDRRLPEAVLVLATLTVPARTAEEPWVPPALPDHRESISAAIPELIAPPAEASLRAGVAIARTAPTVDFLFVPGQGHRGNPWSTWGDGCASEDKYFTAVGDHLSPRGSARVFEYDAKTKRARLLVDVRAFLETSGVLASGEDYTPGKIHSRICQGRDGWLYYSTHRGSARTTTDRYGYRGDWILRTLPDPVSPRTEVVAAYPVPKHCLPAGVLDPERMVWYAGSAAGEDATVDGVAFLAYDCAARKVLTLAEGLGFDRYAIFARSTGCLYWSSRLQRAAAETGAGRRYDPRVGKVVECPGAPHVRSATEETAGGIVYGTSDWDCRIWAFDVRAERTEDLGEGAVARSTYTTSMDADPAGRYLYYVPGAHGGGAEEGSPVVQFDVKTRTRKVIAFVNALEGTVGARFEGTFSTALSPGGGHPLRDLEHGEAEMGLLRHHGDPHPRVGAAAVSGRPAAPRLDRLARSARGLLAAASIAAAGMAAAIARGGEPSGPRFTDVTSASGLADPLRGTMGHAAAWGDADGDGRLDLYVGTFCDRSPELYLGAGAPVPNRLLLQRGGRFERGVQPALELVGRASGSVFVDLDDDGDLDLYVANNTVASDGAASDPRRAAEACPSALFENDGHGVFRDVSVRSGACPPSGLLARSVGVLDFDGDGLIDLLVLDDKFRNPRRPRSILFRNRGGLTFEVANSRAGLPDDVNGLGIAIADLNGDGRGDFFVSESDRLFVSRGDGTYREATALRDTLAWRGRDAEDVSCGAAFGDVDGDGDFDLAVTAHHAPARNRLYLNEGLEGGMPRFRDVTREAGLGDPVPTKCPHVEVADFDHDGRVDLFVSAVFLDGETVVPLVYRGVGLRDGIPRFACGDLGLPMAYVPTAPAADYDADGDLDLLLVSFEPRLPSRLLRNDGAAGSWLCVQVTGTRTNRMGLGAQVRVFEKGGGWRPEALLGLREVTVGSGFSSGQPAMCHFGLGDRNTCDVEVRFPASRDPVRLEGVRTRQVLRIREEPTGSARAAGDATEGAHVLPVGANSRA